MSLSAAIPGGGTATIALIEHTGSEPLRGAVLRTVGVALDETWLAREDLVLLESMLGQRGHRRRKGELGMTTKSDFSEEEWARIVRAPFVAGMAITLADPGGPIEATKETMAAFKSATSPPSREQLLTEVALDIQSMTQQHQNPIKGWKPTKEGGAPGQQILDELRAARDAVAAKATPEEIDAFGRWLVATAQAAADAAKEGGFMGFNAQRVSEREQTMLDQVRAVVLP